MADKAEQAKKAPTAATWQKSTPIPGRDTPLGDKLREALHAFDAGDYARTRTLTAELADAEDAEVRDAALELRERISIDPVQVVVLSACTAVLAAIVYVWIL